MYVCNCNAITVSEVKRAVRCGARSVDEVFDHFGTEQCCGLCTPDVRDCLDAAAEPRDVGAMMPVSALSAAGA